MQPGALPRSQGSLQVHIPWPLQECSQIPAPLGPQSSHLPNGYNHPHPTQLIKANRAESTLERKTQRPRYTNGEDCYWTQEQEQREKPQKGGVCAQGCALSPLRKRSRNWAGRTAPTGRRGVGAGPQLCCESATYPGTRALPLYKGGVQSLPASLQGPQCRCERALHTVKRSAHVQANTDLAGPAGRGGGDSKCWQQKHCLRPRGSWEHPQIPNICLSPCSPQFPCILCPGVREACPRGR